MVKKLLIKEIYPYFNYGIRIPFKPSVKRRDLQKQFINEICQGIMKLMIKEINNYLIKEAFMNENSFKPFIKRHNELLRSQF